MIFVTSIEDVSRAYGQILPNSDFKKIEYFFITAERELTRGVFGAFTLHIANQLDLLRNNPNHVIPPEESELIQLARQYIVNYGFYENFSTHTTAVGNAGAMQVHSHNTSPVPLAQQNEVRRGFWLKSHYFLELLYETLQKNIHLSSLSVYANSEACGVYNSILCRSNADVKAVVGEWGGLGVFLAIKPHLQKMQRELSALIGNTLITDFLGKRKNDTLANLEKELLVLLQNYMVWGALESAIPLLSITASDSGNLVETIPSTDRYIFKAIDEKAKKVQIEKAKTEKLYYKSQILAFLAQNSSSFPQYTPPANNAAKVFYQETDFGGHLSL